MRVQAIKALAESEQKMKLEKAERYTVVAQPRSPCLCPRTRVFLYSLCACICVLGLRERELAAVRINAADVTMIAQVRDSLLASINHGVYETSLDCHVQEMDISPADAELKLRESKGDALQALRLLIAPRK